MLPHSPAVQEHSQQLTRSLPPDQGVMDLARSLQKRVSSLEDKSAEIRSRTAKIESQLAEIQSLVMPLADAIHLRCVLDVWIHEKGFRAASGSLKTWLAKNRKRLSNASEIPEGDLEDFIKYASGLVTSSYLFTALTFDFRRYRRLGDNNARIVRSDCVARAITRVTRDDNDQHYFRLLFTSLFQHTVEEELDEKQLFMMTIDSGRDVKPEDRMKKLLKAF